MKIFFQEFYALVAAELQQKSLGMWLCDDQTLGMDEFSKEMLGAAGEYVHWSAGLFPAALPQNHPQCDRAEDLFHCLGIFLGKVLQDRRLIDLPLSVEFLKLMCSWDSSNSIDEDCRKNSVKKMENCWDVKTAMESTGAAWFGCVLTFDDFQNLFPSYGLIIRELRSLMQFKQDLIRTGMKPSFAFEEVRKKFLSFDGKNRCQLEELGKFLIKFDLLKKIFSNFNFDKKKKFFFQV